MLRQRFLVVDDHPLFREAVREILTVGFPAAEVHQAIDIEGAAEMIAGRRRGYDLVLLDLALPGTSGFDGLLLLRARFPRQPILVVSGHDDERIVTQALDCGVSGFVSKAADKAELSLAIATAMAGSVYLPKGHRDRADHPSARSSPDPARRLSSLTHRQVRVLHLLCEGKLNKQIAQELGVGEATVKSHVSEILRKLKVASRTQVVIEAAKMGFGPDGEGAGNFQAADKS